MLSVKLYIFGFLQNGFNFFLCYFKLVIAQNKIHQKLFLLHVQQYKKRLLCSIFKFQKFMCMSQFDLKDFRYVNNTFFVLQTIFLIIGQNLYEIILLRIIRKNDLSVRSNLKQTYFHQFSLIQQCRNSVYMCNIWLQVKYSRLMRKYLGKLLILPHLLNDPFVQLSLYLLFKLFFQFVFFFLCFMLIIFILLQTSQFFFQRLLSFYCNK